MPVTGKKPSCAAQFQLCDILKSRSTQRMAGCRVSRRPEQTGRGLLGSEATLHACGRGCTWYALVQSHRRDTKSGSKGPL